MLFSRSIISVFYLVPFLVLNITQYLENVSSTALLKVNNSVIFGEIQSQRPIVNATAVRGKRTGTGGRRTGNGGEVMLEKDGKFYKMGTQGPCGANMIIDKISKNSKEGRCVCGMESPNRMLIYSVPHDRCYKIYTTGPCPSDNWLVIKDGEPSCEVNPCLYFQFYKEFAGREFVWYGGECVELYKPSPLCGSGHIVSFSSDKITPTCIRRAVRPLSLAVPDAVRPCSMDQMLDINSECRNIIILDF